MKLPVLLAFLLILVPGGLRGEPLKNADHWSYQPLERVNPPELGEKHPVDAFVRARLAESGIQPNPPAGRRTLIRRFTFDLHGLPPSPGEIDRFLKDPSEDAIAIKSLVDRLLASPRYGERWARHWLDVARFSESQGFERDKFRPHSWPYRDFVIESLNSDLPYDQFALLQIAGDVIEPITVTGIDATGFLVAGPWDEVGANQASAIMKSRVREEELEDIVSAVGQTFLGITINCARCHDHKFDPIPAKDYFAFKAVFEGIYHGDRIRMTPSEHAKAKPQIDALRKQLSALEKEIKKKSSPEKIAKRDRLKSEIEKTEPKVYAANQRPHEPTRFLERGDATQKGDIVRAGGLSVWKTDLGLKENASDPEQRRAFARWLTSDKNPLFARTIVNRVWHYHFGTGLVATPNDLGVSGDKPSHPQLLDWLAGEFVRQGWSLKKLHTLILTSKTAQQSSDFNTASAANDAENRLLWRFAPKRLEAETIRDSILAVSGELNLTMGGPSDRPYQLTVDNTHFYHFDARADAKINRRTIYRAQVASLRDALLDSLDCPSIGLKTPVRGNTSTPIQALSLMNNPFIDRQSQKLTSHLDAAHPDDPDSQINLAWQLVLGRTPSREEQAKARSLVENHSLEQVCWSLFNATEFVFVK